MTQATAFWDKVAKKYAARPIDDEAAYQEKLKVTQSYFKPDMKVFEFGCGTGSTALIHAPFVSEYLATDISPNMIQIAEEKLSETELSNLKFDVATMADYSSVSEEYDAILGLNILHLMKDYQAVIQQSFAMLKPGGVLVTSTGCLNDGMSYMKFIIPIMKFFGFAPYVEFFSRNKLESVMLDAGFEIVHKWNPPKSKISYFLIARKPG